MHLSVIALKTDPTILERGRAIIRKLSCHNDQILMRYHKTLTRPQAPDLAKSLYPQSIVTVKIEFDSFDNECLIFCRKSNMALTGSIPRSGFERLGSVGKH